MSPSLTWEDGAHCGKGVDLEGVHLPLGTEANRFHTHQQEAHGQKADVHELTDDWKPQDTWKHEWENNVFVCPLKCHVTCLWQADKSEDLTLSQFLELYMLLIGCLAAVMEMFIGIQVIFSTFSLGRSEEFVLCQPCVSPGVSSMKLRHFSSWSSPGRTTEFMQRHPDSDKNES